MAFKLSANFGFCNINTTCQLFMSYGTSFYVVCLWNLQDKYVDEFYSTWRKSIRKLFIYLVVPIGICFPIQIQIIMNRIVRFMQSCFKCNNTSFNNALSSSFSRQWFIYMSKIFNYILSHFKLDATTLCKYEH